ncbi:DNA polymerase delta interacting protein 2 isoform X2 [Brevipalpus obovatus]|uniref:DNA polymerase delta interacting protein 2 isoform X2 n=1 Tax=Brevipalpus obovatus TaxID=246614 RepID=UPI003D9DB77A
MLTKILAKNLATKSISNQCLVISVRHLIATPGVVKLAEVGKLETPKLDGKYETGQLFIHRVFGYRGVTLFPWIAKVFDRDVPLKKSNEEAIDSSRVGYNNDGKQIPGHIHVYYQTLIDSRDCPFVRAQTEAVTFLGNHGNTRFLYAIPGLDYVAHEDILPYTSTDRHPIHHELFEKFLEHEPNTDPPFVPKDTLQAWQEKNHPWLELSEVHKETTESIRVTAIPFYMGYRMSQNVATHWWRYCIRLENLGDYAVQLRERYWRILDYSGNIENVRGRGVVGQEPILSKLQPAFQYSSHVSLQTVTGGQMGTFKLEREDGYIFECKCPAFSLDLKQSPIPSGTDPSGSPNDSHNPGTPSNPDGPYSRYFSSP